MPIKLSNLFRRSADSRPPEPDPNTIVVVSGLPRSGTSMMMKMLEAGGIPPLTDEIREADRDNPKGYYEFERVKQMDKGDVTWLPEARGKAVKVIAALLKHLPAEYEYQVVFLERDLEETLRSQKKMLDRRGQPSDTIPDEEMAQLFTKHLEQIKEWLHDRPNFRVIFVSYNDVMASPREQAARINRFLGGRLALEPMVEVIDPELYRQRARASGR
jgi:hypothetical protein